MERSKLHSALRILWVLMMSPWGREKLFGSEDIGQNRSLDHEKNPFHSKESTNCDLNLSEKEVGMLNCFV